LRRGIIVLWSVSAGGSDSSRCRFQKRMARLFTVEASARCISTRHVDLPEDLPVATDLLRPSAEKALPDVRTSDALCRTTPPKVDGLLPASSGPTGCHSARHTTHGGHAPRQVRRDRRRVRTTDIEQTRAPSAGSSQTLQFGRQASRSFYSHGSYPAPCRLVQKRPASSKADVLLQTIQPSWLRVAPQSALTRKMRLTNFCNRLTKRAPSGLSDSRVHGLTGFTAPGLVLSRLPPMASGDSSGGASLDGDSPASA